MRNSIPAAIKKTGVSLILRKENKIKKGIGVILPDTDKKIQDKKVNHKGCFRSEIHDYILYADTAFLENAERGDTVSDGKNEYYILWTTAYECRYGGFITAALRKTGGQNNGLC